MSLLNRELLSFPRVFAFPNSSNIGPASATFCKSDLVCFDKNSTMCFAVSVLPDPETPVINIDWRFL